MKNRSNLLFYVLVLVVLALIGFLFSNKNEVVVLPNANNNSSSSADGLQSNSPWVWQKTTYGDGSVVTANNPEKFILTFESADKLSSTTDCNNLSGSYQVNGQNLTISQLTSTLMYCENSQESVYSQMLQDTNSYDIKNSDTLELKLKTNGGVATFVNY